MDRTSMLTDSNSRFAAIRKAIATGETPKAETVQLTCACGREFEFQRFDGVDLAAPDCCQGCTTEHEEKERSKQVAQRINAKVPPAYRNNDLTKFPPEWARIKEWQPKQDGQGLGLIGDTGKCKTRMVFEMLVRQRLRFDYITGFGLQLAAQEKWKDDAQRAKLATLRKSKVLVIDDLGKQRWTEAGEAEVFDIVEERTSHLRPIIFTSNQVGKDLEKVISDNVCGPLLRRLREYCQIITV